MQVQFTTPDKNTQIINGGTGWKNVGSDICWSRVYSQEFSSGVNELTFHLDRVKVYGSSATNTYIGAICGKSEVYITGDGHINIEGNKIKEKNAAFGSGVDIAVTVDCSSRKISWKIKSHSCSANFPSSWNGSIKFFGQVIQNGNTVTTRHSRIHSSSGYSASASSSNVILSTNDKNTRILNGGKAFENIGSDICWSRASSQSFSSGMPSVTFHLERAKMYGGHCSNTYVGFVGKSECYISGDGKLHIDGNSSSESNAFFSEGNRITCTINFSARKLVWDNNGKTISVNFPSSWSSDVKFFAQVIRKGDRISIGGGGGNFAPQTQLARGDHEIISSHGSQVVVNSKPWITTQDFGQIVVFKLKTTVPDISTQWRGRGWIENVNTGAKMPLYCIHYFNNSDMCFVQTLEHPFGQPKNVLDDHINEFERNFPIGARLRFVSSKDEKYTRVPSTGVPTGPNFYIVDIFPVGQPAHATFHSPDKNTQIILNGRGWKNIGNDICWSKAVSQSFNSGTVTTCFQMENVKEYGGKASNTWAGFVCGTTEVYITGDGKLHIDGQTVDCNDAVFSSGSLVKMTISFSDRSLYWLAGTKTIKVGFPQSFTSNNIAFFGKVIRQGDFVSSFDEISHQQPYHNSEMGPPVSSQSAPTPPAYNPYAMPQQPSYAPQGPMYEPPSNPMMGYPMTPNNSQFGQMQPQPPQFQPSFYPQAPPYDFPQQNQEGQGMMPPSYDQIGQFSAPPPTNQNPGPAAPQANQSPSTSASGPSGSLPLTSLTSKNLQEACGAFANAAQAVLQNQILFRIERNENRVAISADPRFVGELEEMGEALTLVFSNAVIADVDIENNSLIVKGKTSLVSKKLEELLLQVLPH